MIDKAVLRPGRIDKHIYCGFPNEKKRKEILEIYVSKIEADDIDLNKISNETENFTPADLKGLVCNAQLKAIDKIEEIKGDVKFTQKDIEEALQEFEISLKKRE